MRVYISGPISGRQDGNKGAFAAAAEALRTIGHEPVNPHDITDGSDGWLAAMKSDIKAMMDCDVVAHLPDSGESRGASVEMALASLLGMPCLPLHAVVENHFGGKNGW